MDGWYLLVMTQVDKDDKSTEKAIYMINHRTKFRASRSTDLSLYASSLFTILNLLDRIALLHKIITLILHHINSFINIFVFVSKLKMYK